MATATVQTKTTTATTGRKHDNFAALLRPASETGITSDSSVVSWIQTVPGSADQIDQAHIRLLITQAQQTGDTAQRAAARDELVRLNLRLVFTIATKYQHRGLDLWDLMQEGCMGLLQAAEKFDVGRENHFATYAIWWIRCYIQRAVNAQRSPIRLPEYAATLANRILRLASGGMMTDAEIAVELDMPEDEVRLLRTAHGVLSLDRTMANRHHSGVYDNDTLADLLTDDAPATEMAALASIADSDLRTLLRQHLSERECMLLQLRLGLPPYDRTHTLMEASARLGISRERVRQITEVALARLKSAMSEVQWRELLTTDDADGGNA